MRLNKQFPELNIQCVCHTFNPYSYNLVHRKRTLSTLRKRLGIASVRKKNSTPEERAQALLDIKVDDIAGRWGVPQVRQCLVNHGILISR